jgi:hypothetical protein
MHCSPAMVFFPVLFFYMSLPRAISKDWAPSICRQLPYPRNRIAVINNLCNPFCIAVFLLYIEIYIRNHRVQSLSPLCRYSICAEFRYLQYLCIVLYSIAIYSIVPWVLLQILQRVHHKTVVILTSFSSIRIPMYRKSENIKT